MGVFFLITSFDFAWKVASKRPIAIEHTTSTHLQDESTDIKESIEEDTIKEAKNKTSESAATLRTHSIHTIPNPKQQGHHYYVSNPDGVLTEATVSHLNSVSENIEKATGVEFAIVVVKDFETEDDFGFALNLFNNWGIGKMGADNGLLLFIATDQQRYRFISGSGIEGIFTDYYLHHIGEKFLVPNFKKKDYDQGVIAASGFIKDIFLAPNSKEELAKMLPNTIPFWNVHNPYLQKSILYLTLFLLLYLYLYYIEGRLTKKKHLRIKDKKLRTKFSPVIGGCGGLVVLIIFSTLITAITLDNPQKLFQIKNVPYFVLAFCMITLAIKINTSKKFINSTFKRDRKNQQEKLKKWRSFVLLPILITPIAWFDLLLLKRQFTNNQNRFTPPDSNGDWKRINRNDIPLKPKKYLDEGQLKEESLKSLRYEIWENIKTKEIKLVPWEKDKHYSTCPNCRYYTYRKKVTKTIEQATYTSTGLGEEYSNCLYCQHVEVVRTFTIPKKRRSSRGVGGVSSGGSSSGGGSSFGGGSSGGGGAGGRW